MEFYLNLSIYRYIFCSYGIYKRDTFVLRTFNMGRGGLFRPIIMRHSMTKINKTAKKRFAPFNRNIKRIRRVRRRTLRNIKRLK